MPYIYIIYSDMEGLSLVSPNSPVQKYYKRSKKGEILKMLRKKNFLAVITLLLLILVITGCNIPKPTKGIISGIVLMPPAAKQLSKDISGWVPAAGAEVTIVDANGVKHTVITDENGYYSFENIAVRANTVVTATVKVDGKTMVLKTVIDRAVGKEQTYDIGTMTPESTALALVVERLIAEGKGIDLDKIKDADSFADLVDEINGVLENYGNVIGDKGVKDLIDKTMNELYPEEEEPPVLRVSAISITTDSEEDEEDDGFNNNAKVTVTLSTSTTGATIYYTLNGTTDPTSNSTKYTTSFEVKTDNSQGETIVVQAIGVKSGYNNSTVSTKEIVFNAKIITVTFNPNGGRVRSWQRTREVSVGGTYGELPVPSRRGYTFRGWYTKKTGGDRITKDTEVIIDKNHTLYAHWKRWGRGH